MLTIIRILIYSPSVFLVTLFLAAASFAEKGSLVFSTPPTQSPEVTKQNYQPLVDYLSKAIGKKIILKPAKNFHEYTRKMRSGQYDILFDGPHFVNWRIKKQNHMVVAKQPGELHFAIVVRKESSYNSLRDIWTLTICTPAVPHLGTLTLLNIYSNPIREPLIEAVQSFKHALQCLRDGRGAAALVRDKFWYKKANKEGLRVIHITKQKMPARALSVNNKVSRESQRRIKLALTSEKGRQFAERAFSTIGGGKFVDANTSEFEDLGELMKIVWGFHL